ncbi:MAG: tripartite tricarboxylate transporter substrate binding protein [Bdellovibrionales bacterium]|nr:tripartite tricarboxylate transporter substrate binding protein [Ramlibacter sp.]
MRHIPHWARALCAGLALTLPLLAQAQQAYPTKPIKLIVPFTAGGAVDIYARTVQAALAEELGQPVVVENRAGASGMIGAEAVAKSPPDGYTLMVGNIAILAMNPGVYPKMPFDVQKDFTPIIQTVQVNYVLVVTTSLPVKTVGELIAYAKANPGKLTYGSSGSGSAQHMAAELFKAQTKTFITHIPYKGTGALVGDLIAGHISLIFADQGSMMPQVKAGKLRALAVGGKVRSPDYPDIPTVAEAGKLPGFEAVAWQGIAGPAGMPASVVKRLSDAFNKIQADPAMQAKLNAVGLTPVGGSPEKFGGYIKSEMGKWTKVAKDIGATAD